VVKKPLLRVALIWLYEIWEAVKVIVLGKIY